MGRHRASRKELEAQAGGLGKAMERSEEDAEHFLKHAADKVERAIANEHRKDVEMDAKRANGRWREDEPTRKRPMYRCLAQKPEVSVEALQTRGT